MKRKALNLSLINYKIEICISNQLPWTELSSQSLNAPFQGMDKHKMRLRKEFDVSSFIGFESGAIKHINNKKLLILKY